jgi:hypothetical protein
MDHLFGGLWHDGSQCFVVFYLHTSCLEWYVYKYLLWWTGVEIWRSNCIGFIVTVQIYMSTVNTQRQFISADFDTRHNDIIC